MKCHEGNLIFTDILVFILVFFLIVVYHYVVTEPKEEHSD